MKRPIPILALAMATLTVGWLWFDADGTRPVAPTPAPTQPDASARAPDELVSPTVAAAPLSAKQHPVPAALDRTGARQIMQGLADRNDCRAARNERWPRYWAMRTGVAWLPADEQARARNAFTTARARLLQACQRQGLSEHDDSRGQPRPARLEQLLDAIAPELAAAAQQIEDAANAGDLEAQLAYQSSPQRRSDFDAVIRPLLNGVLAEVAAGADPSLLTGIGRLPAMYRAGPELGALTSWYGLQQVAGAAQQEVNQVALWMLVACDLGMECGATSVVLDRLCLLQGLCGYRNVDAALRDGMIRGVEASETEARRKWAVARIRSGQIAGMFDPVATPPGRH